jgi:hypothetical protein
VLLLLPPLLLLLLHAVTAPTRTLGEDCAGQLRHMLCHPLLHAGGEVVVQDVAAQRRPPIDHYRPWACQPPRRHTLRRPGDMRHSGRRQPAKRSHGRKARATHKTAACRAWPLCSKNVSKSASGKSSSASDEDSPYTPNNCPTSAFNAHVRRRVSTPTAVSGPAHQSTGYVFRCLGWQWGGLRSRCRGCCRCSHHSLRRRLWA